MPERLLDPAARDRVLPVEALGVDAQQDLDGLAGPLGGPWCSVSCHDLPSIFDVASFVASSDGATVFWRVHREHLDVHGRAAGAWCTRRREFS
jgi:hypothetical protein